eukprot:COSAG02_NODE_1254_length_13584_cov_15.001483_15_plen_124_part_00
MQQGPIGGFQLSGSPFHGFDEEEIYYHGGTAVAIQAGLLNKTEIAYAHSKMLANVAAAGGKTTLGLALYPPYPRGSFSYGMVRPLVCLSNIAWTESTQYFVVSRGVVWRRNHRYSSEPPWLRD